MVFVSRRNADNAYGVYLGTGKWGEITCVNNDVNEVHTFGECVPKINMVEGDNSALPLGPLDGLLTLHSLLLAHLVLVELGEIVDDDGNRQCNDQYAANRAHRADYLSQARRGRDVSVADGRHRDDGPPERLRDGPEGCVVLVLLGKVDERRENEDAHAEEEEQEAHLLVGVLERVSQGLEAGRVPGQFEDPEDTHDSEHLDNAPDALKAPAPLLGLDEEQGEEIGHDGQYVYHIHSTLDKLPLVGRRGEPQDVLQREPGDAHGFDHGQLGVVDLVAAGVVLGDGRDCVQGQCDC